jgi:hypothetical protein
VERAKRSAGRVGVTGGADPYAAERSESALWLLVAVQGRRTARGWQVVDAVRRAGSQRGGSRGAGGERAVGEPGAAGQRGTSRRNAVAHWPPGCSSSSPDRRSTVLQSPSLPGRSDEPGRAPADRCADCGLGGGAGRLVATPAQEATACARRPCRSGADGRRPRRPLLRAGAR